VTNAVDILIRFNSSGEEKLTALQQRLMGGGPMAQKFAQAAGGALQALRKHGDDAAVVLGRIGTVLAGAGERINAVLSGAVDRLMGLAKWGTLAGVAFAGWQIKRGVEANAQIEQMTARLAVLYRSQALANREMQRFRDFAAGDFALPDVVEAGRVLDEFGLSHARWLEVAGDTAKATGANLREIAQALAQFASGREESAARSFMGAGVNLRAISGLRWSEQGRLLTPNAEATGLLQEHLARRFGGARAREETTFSGALNRMGANLALARARMTEALFERLRDQLNRLNAGWDRMMDSPRAQRLIGALRDGLGAAAATVERLVRTFADATAAGGFGAGLKAVWTEIEAPLRAGAEKFLGWLGRALGEALTLAWHTFWKASAGTKLAVGGVAALMAAPTVGRVIARAPEMATAGGAALRLGGAAGGAALNAAGGAMARTLPALSAQAGAVAHGAASLAGSGLAALGGWTARLLPGASIVGSWLGGVMPVLAAAAVPLALAAAAGLAGRALISALSERKTREADRNAHWLSAESRAFHKLRDAMMERGMAERQDRLRRILTEGAAAWREVLRVQERMTDLAQGAMTQVRGAAEHLMDAKLRTPEERVAARLNQIAEAEQSAASVSDAMEAVRAREAAGTMPPEEAQRRMEALFRQGVEAETRKRTLQLEILSLEQERLDAVRKEREAFGQRLAELTTEDRLRLPFIQQYLGNATGAELAGRYETLDETGQRLARMIPGTAETLNAALREQQTARGLALPEAPDMRRQAEDVVAGMSEAVAQWQARAGSAEERRRRIEEDTVRRAQQEVQVTVKSDTFRLVVSADSGAQAKQVVDEVVRQSQSQIRAGVEELVKRLTTGLRQEAQRMVHEEIRRSYRDGEASLPG